METYYLTDINIIIVLSLLLLLLFFSPDLNIFFLKHILRAESKHAEMMTENINRRLELIEKFSQARKLYDRNPGAMVEMCLDLLRARSSIQTKKKIFIFNFFFCYSYI